MKKKLFLTLGLLGVMAASMFGSAAFADNDRWDRRDGWRNNRGGWSQRDCRDNRRSWRQNKRAYRAANRSNWWNNRVSARPGNRWGYYRNHPANNRGWW